MKVVFCVGVYLAAIALIVLAGSAVVFGVPYLMAETGYAAWLIESSKTHPVAVGAFLLLTGLPLFAGAVRVFGSTES